MKGHAVICRASGDVEHGDLGAPPDPEWLKEKVGEGAPAECNDIELVPMFDTLEGKTCVAFCNEEGKLLKLPVNDRATTLWADAVQRQTGSRQINDVLCGTVVILTGDAEFMESL